MLNFEKIYPVSAMQRKQGELKQAAREGIVRITENGSAAYVFCSEDIFMDALEQTARDAAFAARLDEMLARGRDDVSSGRFHESPEDALNAIEAMRTSMGLSDEED
ncbi:hypothetical protein [Arabiibacter massiliensis]|uniref:hypothetical protein n=1 Tax=Arabiibacter massiliensis TaxID=1870985 RepID=UPI0009BA50E8|nr:hypothetical protein [Arabiibacter massiliensis]